MDNFPELGFGVPRQTALYAPATAWLRRHGLALLALACLSIAFIRLAGLPTGNGPIHLPAVSAAALIPVDNTPTPSEVTSSCQRASSSQPQQLDLSTRPIGLTTVSDPIDYYAISGANDAALRQQIISCAPQLSGQDQFTGYTVYAMDWSYDYNVIGGGQCRVANAKVGLRISEVLPKWHDASAAAVFAEAWQNFMTKLELHESGHIKLDEQYAARAAQELENFGTADCSKITGLVNARMNSTAAALNAANNNYDAATNHGATQGAILP